MLGGGQLGRYFVMAAHELGYQVWVLDPDPMSPAGRIADRHLVRPYDDLAALNEIAQHCSAVTTEFENIPAQTLEHLAKSLPVRPNASALRVCQNRITEKTFLRDHALPHAPFGIVEKETDLNALGALRFPAILKVARNGYDGKGQARVQNLDEAQKAFHALGEEACILEQMLHLDAEFSIVLARDIAGHVVAFTPGENLHHQGILDITIAPANIPAATLTHAQTLAEHIAQKLAYVGVLGVEFFIADGTLYVNEMAPRPHNSGHHTLDACYVSQYEQQVRAVTGLPLAPALQHSPAVMVNILGDVWFREGSYQEPNWSALAGLPGLKIHLYGKTEPRPGRKMGHLTVVGEDRTQILKTAYVARQVLGIDQNS